MLNPFPSSIRVLLALLLLFLFLSLADLFLTWKLIDVSHGAVFESNPMAGWWLSTYGWGGLTAFKLGMVAAIGALAGLITYRRPRAGEMIVVFACGVQSAVVLSSVYLGWSMHQQHAALAAEVIWFPEAGQEADGRGGLPRSYAPGMLPENGMILLLGQASVQEELRLSAAHVKQIAQLESKRRDIRLGARRLNRDEWNAQVQELLAEEKAFLDELESEQAERLQQIAWQQRGPFAFLDPDVSTALELTAEQKDTIRAILGENRNPRWSPGRPPAFGPDAARRSEEDLNRTRERLWAVLTLEQKDEWKEMTGTPFRGELRTRTPGAFGPPGPSDPRRFSRP